MKRYITEQIVILRGGLLTLNPNQARRRAHQLNATDTTDVFRIIQPVQFKTGEEFGFDGDVPKALKEVMKVSADESIVKKRGRPKGS